MTYIWIPGEHENVWKHIDDVSADDLRARAQYTKKLRANMLAIEQLLAPSRWRRLLMWFGLKKDNRLAKRRT